MMIAYRYSVPCILFGVVLLLNGVIPLFSIGHKGRPSTQIGTSSRKLMEIEANAPDDELIEFETYQSDLDELLGRFEYRRALPTSPPPPPPPPPHPARYEICQGIQHKRYTFVRTFDEIKNALKKAKPGDLIEVKSGVYFQGSGPGKSSLIPPDLHVDSHGNSPANRRDPREKKLMGKMIRSRESDPMLDQDSDDEIFATLYDLYSEAYLLPLVEQDSAPAPAPAPQKPSNKSPSNKPSDVSSSVDTNAPDSKDKDGPPSSPPPKTKPGKDKEAVAPAPAPSPKEEEEIIEMEYDEDRYEFGDLEEYLAIEDEEDAKAPAPDKERPPGPRPGPWVAPSGFIDNLHGTEEDPITLCGPKTAVFDGSNGDGGLAAAALRVVRSSHVVVKGFTLQNALKGLDVQRTNSSIFSNISTRYTLQEGIRLRYNSTYNQVHGCNISYTGRLWVGIGEGMYVGTSTRNSIAAGLPKDLSDFNNITSNHFGEGVTAENIDIKEFTTGGVIANNTFNGSSIAGLNGAIAWVAIKGNNYTVANNTGFGTLRGGQGFRVLQKHKGLAQNNAIMNNTCLDFELGSFCVFIDSLARNTKVNCNNKRLSTRALDGGFSQEKDTFSAASRVCNCQIDSKCPSTAAKSNQTTMFIKALNRGDAQQLAPDEFYAQGYPVLPRDLIRDLRDSRPLGY